MFRAYRVWDMQFKCDHVRVVRIKLTTSRAQNERSIAELHPGKRRKLYMEKDSK